MGIEIHLKVLNPCPLSKLSTLLGKSHFYSYCNDYYDLIMMEGEVTQEIIDTMIETLGVTTEITFTSNQNSPLNYIMMDCSCSTSWPVVDESILKNHGINISPVRYQDGWEYHRFVCISKKDVSAILKELEDKFQFEILSIKEDDFFGPIRLLGLSAPEFMESLTKSQLSLLQEAYQEGYYKIPRKVKLADIATKSGISRYAVESRLRRGENAIMDLVLPLIGFNQKIRKQRISA
ncbi:MAG: helix-turn-helix domain-containing protein [Candidatus Heimdallarchaeota archaeon]|nr:helix-turn-helix domain-containing protein [Candidatus Heimdallarchaeota archaeon]